MMRHLLLLILLPLSLSAQTNDQDPTLQFDWKELVSIPPAKGSSIQPGLAGAFTGVHNDALIIAGGANFPNGGVWDGGTKAYHDDIYILEKSADDEYLWIEERSFSLPQEIAYGLTIPTEGGLVCIGGMDGSETLSSVYLLKWDNENKEVAIDDFPALPIALANMSGGIIGNKIYVAASDDQTESKHFLSLDLKNLDAGWKVLPLWGGAPRTHAVGVVQSNGAVDCFYLFKGRFRGKNNTSTLHDDSWVYNPNTNEWKELKTAASFLLAAGTGIDVGANHILLFGGDDGKVFNGLEKLGADINTASDTSLQKKLIEERDGVLKTHKGFNKNIWVFHTITQSWTKVGELPSQSQVTTTALRCLVVSSYSRWYISYYSFGNFYLWFLFWYRFFFMRRDYI